VGWDWEELVELAALVVGIVVGAEVEAVMVGLA
jgi:hypothetical protein